MEFFLKPGTEKDTLNSESLLYSDSSGLRKEVLVPVILWIIIGLGIFLRLYHFFQNRSLWHDEVFLVNSLIRMDFLELATQPLMYEQKAPIGFLWAARLSVLIFGKSEMAVRLFSLISGLAALVLFIPVGRYFLKSTGMLVAVGIMAFSSQLIYHSVEAKQYSTELLATVLVLYFYIQYHKRRDLLSLIQWGILGAIVLWFSYSSIFILVGMAFGVCLSLLIRKDWKFLFRSLIPFSLWMVSFGINYLFFTSRHAGSEWLVEWFNVRGAFMPFPPASLGDLSWFFHATYATLRYGLGLLWIHFTHENQLIQLAMRMPFLPLIPALLGVLLLFRKNRQDLMVLVFPVLLVLLASGLKMYPFFERLTVFLSPVFILFIAIGCQRVANLFPERSKWKYALPVLILAGPVMNSGVEAAGLKRLGDHYVSKQREGFIYINERFKEGDLVYVYWNSFHYYQCFKEMFHLKYDAIEGKDKRNTSLNAGDYLEQIGPESNELHGKKRIWIVYSKHFKYPLGDLEGQPEWYEAEISDPGEILYKKVAETATELDVFENGEYKIGLFELPASL